MVATLNPGGEFSTNALPFMNLASGSSSTPFNVFFNTTAIGQFSGQYQLNLSDQKDLPGHGAAQVLTLNVDGIVSANTTTAGGGTAAVGGSQSTFDNVVTPGTLTSTFVEPTTPAELDQAIGAAAAGQIDFALVGSTPQLWDLKFSARFQGDATVTLHFDPSLLGGFPLSDLRLFHFENGSWVTPPNQVIDPVNDTITFTTDGFSPFALSAVVPEPGTLTLLFSALLGLAGAAYLRRRRAKA